MQLFLMLFVRNEFSFRNRADARLRHSFNKIQLDVRIHSIQVGSFSPRDARKKEVNEETQRNEYCRGDYFLVNAKYWKSRSLGNGNYWGWSHERSWSLLTFTYIHIYIRRSYYTEIAEVNNGEIKDSVAEREKRVPARNSLHFDFPPRRVYAISVGEL